MEPDSQFIREFIWSPSSGMALLLVNIIMQAIQLFHYKCLMEYLYKLQQQNMYHLPCEHAELIAQHVDKLKEIYTNYQLALDQVSFIITQYEDHKRSIRKLVKHHKRCKRSVKGESIFNTKL